MRKARIFEPHEGFVPLTRDFTQIWSKLDERGPIQLSTKNGATFTAQAGITSKGNHKGQKNIKFKKHTGK